jgi:hypothetical protein
MPSSYQEMEKTLIAILIVLGLGSSAVVAQNNPLKKDPWTKSQLMAPSVLAELIKNPKVSKPLIFNIGVVENIKGAINMGASSEKENLLRFKRKLSSIPKNSTIVIYCGCCPFERCPNIRPAFNAMQQAGFKSGLLLNLPTNVKVDWINKGFPLD